MLINRCAFALILLSLSLIGCSKNASEGSSASSSSLSLQMPNQTLHGGLGALSGSACYAVHIKASDISGKPASSCDPEYGQLSPLVPPGGLIDIETVRGVDRKIEVLYVISDKPCDQYTGDKGLGEEFGSNRVFVIGEKDNVAFDQSEVKVSIQIEYPSASNSFATLASTPTTCDKAGAPINVMARKQARVVLGAQRALTSGGQLMHVRVLDQKIEIKNPSDFAGKILPNRLGDEQ